MHQMNKAVQCAEKLSVKRKVRVAGLLTHFKLGGMILEMRAAATDNLRRSS